MATHTQPAHIHSLCPPERYRYRAAARVEACPPDLTPDYGVARAAEDGWIAASPGDLFHGRGVGWRALSVKDQGIDIDCEWDGEVFVDRLLFAPDVIGNVSSIKVFARAGERLKQIGSLDERALRDDEFLHEQEEIVPLLVGHQLRQLVVRIETRLADVVLAGGISMVAVRGAQAGIFPPAPGGELAPGGMPVGQLAQARIVALDPADGGDGAFAAEHLARKLEGAFGVKIPVESGSAALSAVVVSAAGDASGRVVRWLDGVDAASDEQFTVLSEPDLVAVASAGRRGLLYGVETVVQQLAADGEMFVGSFADQPAHEFRGVHLPIPGPSQVEYFRRLIRWVLLPARYNTVILEFAGGMELTRHPEVNDAWLRYHAEAVAGERPMPGHFNMVAPGECLPQSAARELVDELRELGFDVIPEVQSLSHVQYLTVAHPEIAEIAAGQGPDEATGDTFVADARHEDYPSCYCPSTEASYELIVDVLEEILDVVRPTRYVHLGHDEVYQIGVCAACRQKDPAELFAADVNRLNAVVAARGLTSIIWADMLQPIAPYRTAPALASMPAGIVLMDFIWYFHLDLDIERQLLESGFPVVIGNLYSSHFHRYGRRSARPGIMGGQISTWVSLDDHIMGREGKLYDLFYTAIMLWSRGYQRHLRLTYDRRIAAVTPTVRDQLQTGRRGRPPGRMVDLLAGRGNPSPNAGRVADDPLLAGLAAQAGGAVSCRGTDYPVSRPIAVPHIQSASTETGRIEIDVPAGVGEVHIVHAQRRAVPRICWQDLDAVGRYRLEFADGGAEDLDILAAGNIGVWDRRAATPLPTSYYRHQGYGATYFADPINLGQLDDGRDVCFYRLVWRLPDRVESPARLVLESISESGAGLIVLAAVGVLTEPSAQ